MAAGPTAMRVRPHHTTPLQRVAHLYWTRSSDFPARQKIIEPPAAGLWTIDLESGFSRSCGDFRLGDRALLVRRQSGVTRHTSMFAPTASPDKAPT